MKRIVWHYTYSQIDEILRSGVLLPPAMIPGYAATEYNVPQGARENGGYIADKKLLLFSSNQVWEPASYRGYWINGTAIDLLRPEQYDRLGVAMHRIGVDASVLKPWIRLKAIVRMPDWMGRGLEETARQLGSNPVSEWWGTTVPVPAAKWEAVESRVNGVWQPMFEEAA